MQCIVFSCTDITCVVSMKCCVHEETFGLLVAVYPTFFHFNTLYAAMLLEFEP